MPHPDGDDFSAGRLGPIPRPLRQAQRGASQIPYGDDVGRGSLCARGGIEVFYRAANWANLEQVYNHPREQNRKGKG